MFWFSNRQVFAAFSISITLLSATGLADEITTLADSKDLLNTLPIELPKVFNFKIPSRPAGHVLDTANFLPAAMKQSIEDALSQEARDYGVYIYLLTVPSVEKNTLDPFTQQVTQAWMKDLFGATLVFDDGNGRVAIQQSDEVTKRFYEFELSQLLRETNSATKRPRLSRAGLDYTVGNVKSALHDLKIRANLADHKTRMTQLGLAILGLLAVLIGTWEYSRRRQGTESESRDEKTTISAS